MSKALLASPMFGYVYRRPLTADSESDDQVAICLHAFCTICLHAFCTMFGTDVSWGGTRMKRGT
eukprot:3194722-Rhodomonas_salina.3